MSGLQAARYRFALCFVVLGSFKGLYSDITPMDKNTDAVYPHKLALCLTSTSPPGSERYIAKSTITALKELYGYVWVDPKYPLPPVPYDAWLVFGGRARPSLLENNHPKPKRVFSIDTELNAAVRESDVIFKTLHHTTPSFVGPTEHHTQDSHPQEHENRYANRVFNCPACWVSPPYLDRDAYPQTRHLLVFDYQPVVEAPSADEILGCARRYAIWNCPCVNSLEEPQVWFFRRCLEMLTDLDIKTLFLLRHDQAQGRRTGVPDMLRDYDFNLTPLQAGMLDDAAYEQLVRGAFVLMVGDNSRQGAISCPLALANGVPVFCSNSNHLALVGADAREIAWAGTAAGTDYVWRNAAEGIALFESIRPEIHGVHGIRPLNCSGVETSNYYQYIDSNPLKMERYSDEPHLRVKLAEQMSEYVSLDAVVEQMKLAIRLSSWGGQAHYRRCI